MVCCQTRVAWPAFARKAISSNCHLPSCRLSPANSWVSFRASSNARSRVSPERPPPSGFQCPRREHIAWRCIVTSPLPRDRLSRQLRRGEVSLVGAGWAAAKNGHHRRGGTEGGGEFLTSGVVLSHSGAAFGHREPSLGACSAATSPP